MESSKEQYPQGHFIGLWMGIGIAIFSGIGIPLSIITDNPGFIGIGPAIGVGFGISIGQVIENKYKKQGKILSRSESEFKRNKIAVFIGIIILIIGLILALMI